MSSGEPEKLFLTLHPDKKRGSWIRISQYEEIKNFIQQCLSNEEHVTLHKLLDLAAAHFSDLPADEVVWTTLVVKLDLEARGLIKATALSKHDRAPVLRLSRKKKS